MIDASEAELDEVALQGVLASACGRSRGDTYALLILVLEDAVDIALGRRAALPGEAKQGRVLPVIVWVVRTHAPRYAVRDAVVDQVVGRVGAGLLLDGDDGVLVRLLAWHYDAVRGCVEELVAGGRREELDDDIGALRIGPRDGLEIATPDETLDLVGAG